jgi:tetratricopeptide (TPR) repeat protein
MPLPRLLLRAAVPAAGLFALGVGVIVGPWSPLALDRANARYATGDVRGAIVAYEAVARGWHTPSVRAEAARRVGLLRRAEGDVRGAVRAWEGAVDLANDAAVRGQVLVELAVLYREALADPSACAEAFEQAAVETKNAAHDAAAAACWAESGDVDRALEAVDRVEARAGREAGRAALAAVEALSPALADAGEP